MNLRFVEAFYWVATLKSMTRAAENFWNSVRKGRPGVKSASSASRAK